MKKTNKQTNKQKKQAAAVVFPVFADLSVEKKNQQCVGGEKQKRRGFK